MKIVNMNKRGFTLIEFLIYFAIITGLIGTVVLIGTNISTARMRNMSMEVVNQNGRVISERVSREIRLAEEIESVEGDKLILNSLYESTDPVEIYLEGSHFYIKRGDREPDRVSTERSVIRRLNFEKAGDGAVRMDFDVAFYNPEEMPQFDFERSFTTVENLRR